MKKLVLIAVTALTFCALSCKSNNSKTDGADSGQTHVNSAQPADTGKYPVSPVETGGQDTSASGIDPSKPAPDSSKRKQ